MGGKKRTADSFVASDERCQLIKFTIYINRFINRVSCITRKDSPFRSHSYFCSRLWIQHSTDLKRKGGLQAVYGGGRNGLQILLSRLMKAVNLSNLRITLTVL